MNFRPSPAKMVRFVDENGNVVREEQMNRKERRRRRIGMNAKKRK